MARYTGQEIAERAIRFGATPALARIMGAAAMAEGRGDSDAVGDNGTSIGAFQINDIHGLTGDQRRDLDFATAWMYANEFVPAFLEGGQRGYDGEQLARWTCMRAERPYGWKGPHDPGLDSAAADRYAAHWRALGEPPMPTTDLRQAFLDRIRVYWGMPYAFGGKSPQTSFDCSGLLTYAGRVVGVDLGDPMMTNADGLKQYCDPVTDAALPGDLVLFSQTYGEMGPDYATHCGASLGQGTGQMLDTHEGPGVGQTNIYQPYWQEHFLGVWRPRAFADLPRPPAPEPVPAADPRAPLISQLGYLRGDLADALQRALDGARIAKNKAQRDDAYASLAAAIATLRRGGG